MTKIIEIRIFPDRLNDVDFIKKSCARELSVRIDDFLDYKIVRRSIDSRGSRPKFVLRIEVRLDDDKIEEEFEVLEYNISKTAKKVLIVGAGPAGYFAALRCLEIGMVPIVIDRGKDVQERRKDLRQIQQFHIVNPDSNYCFGEGGAGTYSDGKLYTRANKRGNIKKILQILVDHGASSEILIDAHPHIGSNKLPKIIAAIRTTIIENGGQVMFNSKLVDFIINKNQVIGCILENGVQLMADAVILATGHSARDIYSLCDDKNVKIEFKPYAIGVRIEHPQAIIDEIQYNQKDREENLPAASYRLACQVENKGVFSFCMCPGGLIVPAATSPGELVVNGMSLSKRDSFFANAGTVVSLDNNPQPGNPFGGMNYQALLEKRFFDFGDGSQKAPAQKLTDFVQKRASSIVGKSSYIPGIYSAPVHELLPDWIYNSLSRAVQIFGKKMKGYYTDEANVIGLESRTSAPIRIPRDSLTLMNSDLSGLFPCGEGAGYAGGILSAALDGQRVSNHVAKYLSVE